MRQRPSATCSGRTAELCPVQELGDPYAAAPVARPNAESGRRASLSYLAVTSLTCPPPPSLAGGHHRR
eukprot:147391-Chlamydomonas_euryale.AAC.2